MESIRITDRNFFTVGAEELAQNLLGKIICLTAVDNKKYSFRITETEAYCCDDSACHANANKTGNGVVAQNMIGGTVYVHYRNNQYDGSSFDIVSNKKGVGEGVLIRGALNIDNPSENIKSQPRILGEKLHMDYDRFNQTDIVTSNDIELLDDGFKVDKKQIQKKERIRLSPSVNEKDKNALRNYSIYDLI